MSRMLLVVPVVALVISLAPATPAPTHPLPEDPVCFPTRVGDRLVYLLEGREFVNVVTDVKEDKGRTTITLGHVATPFKTIHSQTVVATSRGLLMTAALDVELDPPVWLLKLPHRTGNRWAEKWKFMGWGSAREFETAGWEQVTVPAGSFRAVRVEGKDVVNGETTRGTFWFAPGLGCVKWASPHSTLVLKSFTPGRD
jgi:hypothetical protein